jgi:hypothetical protein
MFGERRRFEAVAIPCALQGSPLRAQYGYRLVKIAVATDVFWLKTNVLAHPAREIRQNRIVLTVERLLFSPWERFLHRR